MSTVQKAAEYVYALSKRPLNMFDCLTLYGVYEAAEFGLTLSMRPLSWS